MLDHPFRKESDNAGPKIPYVSPIEARHHSEMTKIIFTHTGNTHLRSVIYRRTHILYSTDLEGPLGTE